MELLFLEDMSRNCQTLILWFRREIVRNGNDLTQKAKSIFPLALMTLKILSRCLTSWKGRRSAEEESGREGKVMNHQQKITGGKYLIFPLKRSCYLQFSPEFDQRKNFFLKQQIQLFMVCNSISASTLTRVAKVSLSVLTESLRQVLRNKGEVKEPRGPSDRPL